MKLIALNIAIVALSIVLHIVSHKLIKKHGETER